MARLRVLLALCLVTLGATFGALALSGYYNPHAPHGQPRVASADVASIGSGVGAHFIRVQPRHRFVAADSPAEVAPAKPKAPPKVIAAPKPKVVVVKDKRPQQAAAQWPWNLFSN